VSVHGISVVAVLPRVEVAVPTQPQLPGHDIGSADELRVPTPHDDCVPGCIGAHFGRIHSLCGSAADNGEDVERGSLNSSVLEEALAANLVVLPPDHDEVTLSIRCHSRVDGIVDVPRVVPRVDLKRSGCRSVLVESPPEDSLACSRAEWTCSRAGIVD